jgi:hypothetical protein
VAALNSVAALEAAKESDSSRWGRVWRVGVWQQGIVWAGSGLELLYPPRMLRQWPVLEKGERTARRRAERVPELSKTDQGP